MIAVQIAGQSTYKGKAFIWNIWNINWKERINVTILETLDAMKKLLEKKHYLF